MPWLDDMKAVSSALAQPVSGRSAEQMRRRSYQQQVPGGASPKEWDALEKQADQWLGKQPDDRMMGMLQLNAKRAAGEITEEQYQEGMEILYGAVHPPVKAR